MSSINTNTQAMNALSTLRNVNSNLSTTQERIATGLKISSGKDNAAYFSISESMKGDSAMYSAIDEGLTLTKNSVAAARKGAESFQALAQKFTERMAFSQNATDSVVAPTQSELQELVKQMDTIIAQSTFNGDDLVNASGAINAGNQATMKGTAAGDWTFEAAQSVKFKDADLTAAGTAKTTAETAYTAFTAADVQKLSGDDKDTALGLINAARALVGPPATPALDADDFATATLSPADLTAVNAQIAGTLTDAFASAKTAAGDAAFRADLVGKGIALDDSRQVVTGISRAGNGFATTEISINQVDLKALASGFKAIADAATTGNINDSDFLAKALSATNTLLSSSIDASTKLGQSEKSIENQQEFLKNLTDTLDTGVGAMVDADMEAEAARLQALQVQQQLATQSLSIANEGPQNLLSLFR